MEKRRLKKLNTRDKKDDDPEAEDMGFGAGKPRHPNRPSLTPPPAETVERSGSAGNLGDKPSTRASSGGFAKLKEGAV